MTHHPRPLEQATAFAVRDQLHPIPGTRHDTGEPIWLVQSRSDPAYHYLLSVQGNTISCPCQGYLRRGICAHVAAVQLAIETPQPEPFPSSNLPLPSPTLYPHPAPRNEQEQQQVDAADRRDRALLWTDERPFSIWKA